MPKLFLVSVVVFLLGSCQLSADRFHVLEDFESDEQLAARWAAHGDIRVSRSATAAAPNSVTGSNRFVTCHAGSGSSLATQSTLPRHEWERFDKLRFRVQIDQATSENPVTLEFRAFSYQRSAWFWRKISIRDPNWKTIDVPLQYCRHSPGANLKWDEIHRFGFRFRDSATVRLDDIELVADADGKPDLTTEELARLAFGDRATIYRDDQFHLITDDRRVDGEATLAEFQKLRGMILRDFPDLPRPSRPIQTLVFSNRDAYRNFWPRFGLQFASRVPHVTTDGYSLLGIAGSYYSAQYKTVRPVLIHETCHAFFAHCTGLPNATEWLHEGLANNYQLNWTKQDVVAITYQRMQQGKLLPLNELLTGKRIRLNDYAQVAAFVRWLLIDATRRRQFSSAIKAMSQRCSTQLQPICESNFGVPLEQLELAWLRWLQKSGETEEPARPDG